MLIRDFQHLWILTGSNLGKDRTLSLNQNFIFAVRLLESTTSLARALTIQIAGLIDVS
jgi:hypothetical protein